MLHSPHTRTFFRSLPVLLLVGSAWAADPPKPKPVTMTRDELRVCMALKDDIDTKKGAYDRDSKAHDAAWQAISKETEDLKGAKDKVDTKDPKSVTAYNERINAHNKSGETHNARAKALNTSGTELQGVQQRYIDSCNDKSFLVGDREAILKERAAAGTATPAKP